MSENWLVYPNRPYTIVPRICQKASGSFWANCQNLVRAAGGAASGGGEPAYYTKSGGFRQVPPQESWTKSRGNQQSDKFFTKNSCNILCNPTLRNAILFGKMNTSNDTSLKGSVSAPAKRTRFCEEGFLPGAARIRRFPAKNGKAGSGFGLCRC